jgi:hypothetical protein
VLPPWVYTFVAVGVTTVWLIANVVAVVRGVPVDAQLHFLMGGVVGGTIGAQAIERRRAKEIEDDPGSDNG